MADWELLRTLDVRRVFRLIGECRDVGTEPGLWSERVCEGLSALMNAPATSGEGAMDGQQSPTAVSVAEYGFDPTMREILARYHRDQGPARDPLFKVLLRQPEPIVTGTRAESISDASYFRSFVFEEHFQPGNVHHRLVSISRPNDGRTLHVLHLHRSLGEQDFTRREQQLLDFFHAELARLIGRSLVSATEPDPQALPRRLRQTLACLLEGDSEKQAAERLGLSQATTHQYVTELYRRFGVRSRAQLLAHALKRSQRSDWRGVLAAAASGDEEARPAIN